MKEARHLARCPICREAGSALAEQLRALPTPTITQAERDRLWGGIRAEMEARRGWPLLAILPWLRGLARRHPMLAWAPAAAVALLLLLAPLQIGREERRLTQAQLNAQTAIERIEAGLSTSVLVLETPTEHLSIIWVMEPANP